MVLKNHLYWEVLEILGHNPLRQHFAAMKSGSPMKVWELNLQILRDFKDTCHLFQRCKLTILLKLEEYGAKIVIVLNQVTFSDHY